MIIIESYSIAVVMCFITMLCWGSWANTQKLASKEWRFQLFYWDYAVGVLLLAVFMALTMGNMGTAGRGFFADLGQASITYIGYAMLGGIIFNLSNILLVAAIDIAGMAVAFPLGCGLSLILGTVTNYIGKPEGNPLVLFLGVLAVVVAAVLDAVAYGKLPSQGQKTTTKGILISLAAGALMGFFYRFVMKSMEMDFANCTPGKLSPYTATVFFSLGLFLSNFVWNSWVMIMPFVGEPVPFGDYFTKGNVKLHAVGILGGVIWSLGTTFNIVAAPSASPAIAFGLGYGGIMVAALWGVFIWKEFKDAPAGTNKLLALMFACFIIGLGLIAASRPA
ncbi:MAG: multidrug DMT transporter permease [Planctomycetota bacterium]|nr:MAG: multidrug DMT transporter permease [Planctomycetota bacterium]